jgi:hypothetical protein
MRALLIDSSHDRDENDNGLGFGDLKMRGIPITVVLKL